MPGESVDVARTVPAAPRLRWPSPPQAPPVLDPAQQAVVDRVRTSTAERLLVLAGPGTGKTTTLVETVAARIEAGTDPSRVLVLTFSRKAAQELRARLAARLDRTLAAPLAWTFHGFCWSVLAEHGTSGEAPATGAGSVARLLAGPEQDVAVRELVEGAIDDGRSPWPPELAPALRTRGFADELRTLLARARSLGMDPADLAAASDRPDWRAAAAFFEEYLDVLDARGVVDYAEVVLRAARVLEARGARRPDRYDLVLVDEYQDTDPAQETLLRALVPAHGSTGLVVVGDPDQSIYAFRGADVRNITQFPVRFPSSDGAPADVLALEVSRRSGADLLAATRGVIGPSGLPAIAGATGAARRHRELRPADGIEPGEVQVVTYGHEAAEAASIADLLRREHLERGTAWSRMAVVVRSAARSVPRLRRALSAAGVPVEVAADELPLVHESAPRTLVEALECAVDLARPEPTGRLTAEVARALLTSPLGGADAGGLRRLGRALRAEAAQDGENGGDAAAPSSAELLRDCLVDPRLLVGVPAHVARPAHRVAELLRDAAALVAKGEGVYDVLWALWSGTPWPRRLQAASARGGAEGRRADHDLDAVLALFDQAAAFDSRPGRGPANFAAVLLAQQIPGGTLAERGVRPGGVRLLTAHRAKGLEWDVVVVAGVEEDVWPDVRRRGSLLQADRLSADGEQPAPAPSALLAEERRLFYVACTRARRRLVVTAVDSPLEDGPRASRFLADLGVEPEHVDRLPRRPLSLRGLVADLRRVAHDPSSSDALRAAAVERLAALAAAEADGRPLVPSADPARWWGLGDPTRAERPLVDPDAPVRLSGSTVRDLAQCPAQWLLAHEARASGPRPSAFGFGSVVHALADAVVRGTLPPDTGAVMSALDEVWGRLEFAAPWQRELERTAARDALDRFLAWHRGTEAAGRRPLATEEKFSVTLEVGTDAAGPRTVELRGAVDRVDLDADGRVVVVDYKTGRTQPRKKDLDVEPQLGAYQRAVEAGGLDHVLPDPRPPLGGAELVQLRADAGRRSPAAKVQPQAPLREAVGRRAELDPGDGGGWFDRLVERSTERLVTEDLPAVPGSWCDRCEFTRSCSARETGRGVVP